MNQFPRRVTIWMKDGKPTLFDMDTEIPPTGTETMDFKVVGTEPMVLTGVSASFSQKHVYDGLRNPKKTADLCTCIAPYNREPGNHHAHECLNWRT